MSSGTKFRNRANRATYWIPFAPTYPSPMAHTTAINENDKLPGPSLLPNAVRMKLVATNVFTDIQPTCNSPIRIPGIKYPPWVPKVELPTTYKGKPVRIPMVAGMK